MVGRSCNPFLVFSLAMSLVSMSALTLPTPGFAGIVQYTQDFETSQPPHDWFPTGGAGFDWDKGLAHQGKGNAWVRYTQGWNAVNTLIDFSAAPQGSNCAASAWLRVSPDVTDGYISVRPAVAGQAPGPVINEIKLVGPTPPENNGYKQFVFNFQRPSTGVLFYVGLHGNGRDGWIQIDDVVVQCTY